MVNWNMIMVGIALVAVGTFFSLFGTVGSIIGFIIAISVVIWFIQETRANKHARMSKYS
jgi:predicted PurR-regulated permease PerM